MREGKARRELAAFARELFRRRLVTGSSGNLSARLDSERLLCTPAGISFRVLEARDCVVTSLDGAPLDRRTPTSELPLHVAAYAARADIRFIVHTHPTCAVVWSKFKLPLPRDTVGARETLRDVALVPFHPAGSTALAGACAQALRHADNVLLEAHGLCCVAGDLETAFVQTDLAEEAARIALWSRISGAPEGAAGAMRQEEFA